MTFHRCGVARLGAESPDVDGEALRHWRRRHGLTQAALARELAVTEGSVCHWERGTHVTRLVELALRTLGDQLWHRAQRTLEGELGRPAFPRGVFGGSDERRRGP